MTKSNIHTIVTRELITLPYWIDLDVMLNISVAVPPPKYRLKLFGKYFRIFFFFLLYEE